MTTFTTEQLAVVRAFLAQVRERAKVGDKERVETRVYRLKTGPWSIYDDLSETDVLIALWWYRFRFMPGSREWRPGIILRALIKASERDYVEPERIPVNTVALASSPNDRKKARNAFIRKYNVATFYRQIAPILAGRRPRAGGIQGLFIAPATPERRDYVRMLVEIAGRRANGNGEANGRQVKDRVD